MSDTSIRTPAWGVTLIPEHTRAVEQYFNSHPRVGG